METKLERISQLSRENPNMVFTSIGHLINKEMLKSCHEAMDEEKAVGIDGVTKEEYSRNLNQNLESLVERLKKKSYKPKPARLVEIPKDNGKMRPLSIYSYEDKLVQEALRRILEAVFEPCFYDEMMGFRPNRSCHKAIQKLNTMIQSKPVNYVLDADIKGFFDHMDHEWIIRFIESKIKDPNITRLVRREYIQCLSPAKKYKLYKSSINKSIHFVQRSRAANRDNSVLMLSSTYCYCLD